MKTEILITVDNEETRGAILEDDKIMEIFIERPLNERVVGNIYLGRVENVLPGMQAAFVNIGLERNAFLYVDDAYPAVDGRRPPRRRRRPTIRDCVRSGDKILVQVVKEATGTKGARITRNISLPGRYLVLMPSVKHVGVSRKITSSEERRRLKDLAHEVKPNGMGVIVRTVAEGKDREALEQDMAFLTRIWEKVEEAGKTQNPPQVVHKDLDMVYRLIRDYLTENVNAVVIDSRTEYYMARDLVDGFAPGLKGRIQLHEGVEPSLFEKYGVNEAIEAALKRKVWLKSGGYIIIDQPEALTVIDVNTGRYVGRNELEKTVFKTNMEAVDEIARQLRLRDIGGIIIIDFIDMQRQRHRDQVVGALEKAIERDPTRATILGITQLGLVEMTRKKGRKNLQDLVMKDCPYCEGTGVVESEENMSRRVRRDIKRILRENKSEAILVEVHPTVAALLIGSGGTNLKALEQETGKSIFVRGSEGCHMEDMNVRAVGSRDEVARQALPVRDGETIELKIEEAHVSNGDDGIARVEGYVIDIEGAGSRVGERVQVEITKAFRTYAKGRIVENGVTGSSSGS